MRFPPDVNAQGPVSGNLSESQNFGMKGVAVEWFWAGVLWGLFPTSLEEIDPISIEDFFDIVLRIAPFLEHPGDSLKLLN